MGMKKAIESGKEKRKPYRRPKSVDVTCRNHGSCPYCRNNRTYAAHKAEEEATRKIDEYLESGQT